MHKPQRRRTLCTKSTSRCSNCKCKDLRPAVDQIRFVRISQSRHLAKKTKTTFPPQSNHRNQERPLLCTKLARAPVQSKAHLYAHTKTKTTATTHQRHPAHANPPELIPARPPRPGAAHRGHRHSQTPRESTGAAQQDASGQPNAPMLPQSNHRNQVRPLLCTKLARAPVQTKAHLYAPTRSRPQNTTSLANLCTNRSVVGHCARSQRHGARTGNVKTSALPWIKFGL